MEEHFEMVVIGAGPAGEKAAAQAAYFGRRVAIVERLEQPGGAPVNNAGIPTKTLRETALYVTGFRRRDIYGVSLGLDPHTIMECLQARRAVVFQTMAAAVRGNIERHGIVLVRGEATLGPGRTVVVSSDGSVRTLRADVILIATGSRPYHPPDVPFHDPDVLDSESVVGVERPFKSIAVVGGGAVGCEYASIFAALGVDVTLIDAAPRLLPFIDAELSDILADSFRAAGIRVVLGAGRAAIHRDDEGIALALSDGEVLRPDKVLFAAGRAGNTEGLGLEEAGVKADERGRVVVNERFETSAPGIYAAGDVIGPPGLSSVSMEQGRVAACHAFGIPFKLRVDALAPFGVYTIPEVARVGLTEEEAVRQGVDCEVGRGWFTSNARAVIGGPTEGLVKLVFRREDRGLLGVHILGDSAAELIHQGQAVLHCGGAIDYFIDAAFAVPTLSEAYKYAAYDGLQRLNGRRVGA